MRLEIENVKFKNFLSFGSRWQEVDFLQGVNVVLGYDQDKGKSNGSGKSSFLETIPFALFGQVHRNVKKDEIINWRSRRGCEVILSFKKGESSYEVVRGIKPNKFEIFRDGTLIDKPSHAKYYQEILNEIVGLNFQTFMSLVHSNINSSSPILAMKKPEKRKFMEKVFGLELYTRLDKLCNEKKRLAGEKIREIEISDQHNEKSISDLRMRISGLKSKIFAMRTSQSELNEAKEKLESLKDKCEFLETSLRELQGEIELFNTVWDHKEGLILKISNKISEMNIRISYLNNELCSIEDREEKSREKIQKFKEANDLIGANGTPDDIAEKIETIRRPIEDFEGQKRKWEKIANELFIKGSKFKIILRDCDEKIESLEGKSICPTCGQSVSEGCNILDDFKNKRLEALQKIKEIKEEEAFARDEIREFEEEISERESEVRELRTIKDYILTLLAEASASSIEQDKEKKAKLEEDIDRFGGVREKLRSLKIKIELESDEILKEVTLSKEIYDRALNEIREIEECEKEIERLDEKVEIELKNKLELQELIVADETRIKEIMRENFVLAKKKEKMVEMIDYFDFIKGVCKDENVKQFAISSSMPYLNKQTNRYLSEVNYGFYVILDKWLEAIIKGPGITNGSYGSLSGGEGRGIDLALQFAFLDVARIQAGVFPDILVFDELLDSSVDRQGIGKLMDILKVKQQEEKSKLFLISHRPEIDEIEVDNTYFIEKKNGYSTVRLI